MDRSVLNASKISPMDESAFKKLDRSIEDRSAPRLTENQKLVLYPLYKDFEMIRVEGARYGDVIKCTHNYMKQKVAIKIINIPENEKKNGVPCSVIRQISILRELKHPNIVRLLYVIGTEDDVYLVFEYIDISLHKYLYNPLLFSFSKQLRTVLRQILSGVEYYHSHKIIHRDLRPHNIMVQFQTTEVKLTGFGAARTFELPLSSYSGDLGYPCYRAPELLFGSTKYSTAIDIWSVGCIFAEMVTLKPLFNGKHESKILAEIFRLLGTPTEETWPGLSSVCNFVEVLHPPMEPKNLKEEFPDLGPAGCDLLLRMLCMCPERRISAKEALDHPYIQ